MKLVSELPAGARDVAIAAAREAGLVLRERLGQARDIDFKGTVDLVTDADRASEALIISRLQEAFPEHRVLGEEGGERVELDGAGAGSYCWLVDPLDGTTNYAHGYPHFAVSIALAHDRDVLLGVVYDPMRDELFVAVRGHGATLNGRPIRVSTIDQLIRALLATGFSYNLDERAENAAIWDAFLNITQGTRRDGSAALNLCYVAAGRLDGFWERPLQPWDLGAGGLMVREAGGMVTTYDGAPFDPFRREVIASNSRIHAAMHAVISRHARTAVAAASS